MYTVILDTLQTCNILCTVSTYLFTTHAFAAIVNNSGPSIAVMWKRVWSECFILTFLTSAIVCVVSSGLGCIQNSKQKLLNIVKLKLTV